MYRKLAVWIIIMSAFLSVRPSDRFRAMHQPTYDPCNTTSAPVSEDGNSRDVEPNTDNTRSQAVPWENAYATLYLYMKCTIVRLRAYPATSNICYFKRTAAYTTS